MTPHEFYLKYIGKTVDVDGYYGGQCWDLYAQYCRENGIPFFHCTTSGYVKDIWNNRKSSGILNYMDEVPNLESLQDGDVVIWGNCAACPYSHIAIFRKANGNGSGIFLGQNQSAGQVVNQETITYAGIIGGLRIKKAEPVVVHKIAYRVHAKDLGWMDVEYDGQTSGTEGQTRRVEALKIDPRLSNLNITAKAHVENKGWIDYGTITSDTIIGTTGEYLRLEALCLNCTNATLKYRVHIEDTGWSAWTKADGVATLGSVGMAKAIEAIQIVVE